MVWKIKDKEDTLKTCFAILPKKIGEYRVWLSRYYKAYDYTYLGIYSYYKPRYFVKKSQAISYINAKQVEPY